ncbi:MAG: DUF4276 family protein [Hymenobacter sp.]|nr:MAG: DUF4276 family protein [Hymenobacter sp.]
MAKCILFVEGSSNTNNGNLRIGFNKLLKKANKSMPEIKMSDDLANSIKKFKQEVEKAASDYQQILLLVDLDGPEETREAWLAKHELINHREQVFCMIQEMEAWFLSQPDALHTYYGSPLPHTLPKAVSARVSHPAQELERCTKGHRSKSAYHKTNHGADLLGMLSLPKLQADFPDVARLVAAL